MFAYYSLLIWSQLLHLQNKKSHMSSFGILLFFTDPSVFTILSINVCMLSLSADQIFPAYKLIFAIIMWLSSDTVYVDDLGGFFMSFWCLADPFRLTDLKYVAHTLNWSSPLVFIDFDFRCAFCKSTPLSFQYLVLWLNELLVIYCRKNQWRTRWDEAASEASEPVVRLVFWATGTNRRMRHNRTDACLLKQARLKQSVIVE